MISYLTGYVIRVLPRGAIVDVAGMGYDLAMPISTMAKLECSDSIKRSFWVYTRVREDSISLYGFDNWEDRQTFEVLVCISGVGPKVAIAILSTLTFEDLANAVDSEDPGLLVLVPGIGKRTAEKILLELKGKRDRLPLGRSSNNRQAKSLTGGKSDPMAIGQGLFPNWSNTLKNDLQSALENLGFKSRDVLPVLRDLEKDYNGDSFSDLVKKALKGLSSDWSSAKSGKNSPIGRRSDSYAVDDLEKVF